MGTPEAKAREIIDQLLAAAGWHVCDPANANITARRGVAIREFPLKSGHCFADYLLYIDGKAAGIIEAKRQGLTLSGVEPQAAKYTQGLPDDLPAWSSPLPFSYQSTGIETRSTNGLDPEPKARGVFAFHKPDYLAALLDVAWAEGTEARDKARHKVAEATTQYANRPQTFLSHLQHMPPLHEEGLWPAQIKVIKNLEQSLRENRPRALIQMATGSGKTLTAISFIYRLIKFAGSKRCCSWSIAATSATRP
jgi:type I restriction enzyme R subunit